MSISGRWSACVCLALLVAACSSDTKKGSPSSPDNGSDSGAGADSGPAVEDNCPVVVKDADCDTTQRPFVFVHGTYGSGDNFAHVASLLTSNGFCADRIVAVEYNSLGDSPGVDCTEKDAMGKDMQQGCGKIDKVVDEIMAKTGADSVDLAGHSQGTAHCGAYLSNSKRAAKVAHYINFSGVPMVGDTATLSLSSMHDLGNTPHHATGSNVKQVTFTDEDHFAVAASTPSFKEVYKYLTGNDAKYDTIQCGDPEVTIEGLSESFADNAPVAGKLEIRPVTNQPRATGTPERTVMGDDAGHFGPFTLHRNVPYEFAGYGADGKLIGYQYFTPFKRSNRLVRLLSPASATDGTAVGGAVAMASTDHIVHSKASIAMVGRWSGGAFRQDLGASLVVNGTEVLTDVTAGKAALANMATAGGVVGLFMYDDNQNGQSELGMVYSGPFLMFTDLFIGTDKPGFVDMTFKGGSEDPNDNGTLKISNWPSEEEDGNPVTILTMFQ